MGFHVREFRELFSEREEYITGCAISVLGNNDFGQATEGVSIVVFSNPVVFGTGG